MTTFAVRKRIDYLNELGLVCLSITQALILLYAKELSYC